MTAHLNNPDNSGTNNTAMAEAVQRAEAARAKQQATPQPTSSFKETPNMSNQNNTWSLDDDLLDPVLTSANGSEALNAFTVALSQMKAGNLVVKMSGVDNNAEEQWHFGSVILAVGDKSTDRVAFIPMLVEDSANGDIQARAIRLGSSDRTVNVVPLPSDGVTGDYVARMREVAAESFGRDDLQNFLYVPGILLPKGFNFTSSDDCKSVLARLSKSCRDFLNETRRGFPDLNVAKMVGGGIVRVSSTCNRPDLRDTVNQPVRQDIEISLQSGTQPANAYQDMSQVRQAFEINGTAKTEARFGRLSAYIDVRMLPSAPLYGVNQDPRNQTRRFVPELVLTSVELNQISTTSALMLMVSMAAAAVDPAMYKGLLLQRQQQAASLYKNSPFVPTNLGALNSYAGYGIPAGQPAQPYDLMSATVTPAEFMQYVDGILDTQIAVSIDLPRIGAQAAYMAVLSACANGDKAALSLLKESLMKNTNGLFASKFFGPGNEGAELTANMVFAEVNNSVFNGSFNMKVGDENRNLDIRHIDTNAVIARFGQSDKDMVNKWVQSFMVAQIDPLVRMANRRDVIDAYTNGGYEINGISERNTFNASFLQAIVACNSANNFRPVLQYNDPLAGADTGLHAPSFMQNGLFAPGSTGAFTQNGGSTGGVGGAYFNGAVGRF